MSASERKSLESQLRAKYGPALLTAEQAYSQGFKNHGEITEPIAVMGRADLFLKGPTPPNLNATLLEQPGCSNKVSID